MDYLKQYSINLETDYSVPANIRRQETISGTTIAKLERLGFEGTDASLEISLFDYGMAWIEKDGEWNFIHECEHLGQFDNTDFPVDTDWRQEWNWAAEEKNLQSLLSSLGMTEEEFEELPFPQKVHDLVGHWGTMNIFGECHWGGFYIFKDGRKRTMEWFETTTGIKSI